MVNFGNIKAIVIGGDHHNTLAAIRCLGESKIPFITIIHGTNINKDSVFVAKSRYIKNNLVILDEDEKLIVEYLIQMKNENNKKFILFPCSDLSAYIIDNNYSKLKNLYICPGFKSENRLVCELMDKYKQNEFARQNGILVAKSWKIVKLDNMFKIPDDIIFPSIIKPLLSIDGVKSDIRIVKNKIDLERELAIMVKKNYDSLIIQEFINKDFETCAFGCITYNSREIIGGVIKKLREYPYAGGGSMSYAQFIFDKEINQAVKQVCSLLEQKGYSGMYDIEFFVANNRVYLNEINFRHSGNGHALVNNDIKTHKLWVLDAIKSSIKNENKKLLNENFLMDDILDLHYIIDRKINIFTWIKQFINVKSHTVFSFADLGASIAFYKKITKLKIFKINRK